MKSFAFATALASFASQAYATKCYALAFGSGDQSAAFQVGALKALIEKYPAMETQYSAVSGVGGGAVNAAILSSFPLGQEADAVARMQTFWENSGNTKLWQDWTAGVAEGMFFKGGLYNNQGLYNFLASELVDIVPNQRYIDVPLTNVLTSAVAEFYSTDLSDANTLKEVMFGNFGYPGFFAPEVTTTADALGSNDWFTGGLIWDVDLFSIVNQCMSQTMQEEIVVDVLLSDHKSLPQIDASNLVTYQYLLRAGRIIRWESQMDGLMRAQFAYPKITFRNIIAPTSATPLPAYEFPLMYNFTDVGVVVANGYTEGLAAASNPGDAMKTMKFFGLKRQRDSRVRGMSYEQFLEADQHGEFDHYEPLLEKKLQALFAQ